MKCPKCGYETPEEDTGKKRDADIAEKYRAGDTTMQVLADEYGLSRQRIRGIIHNEMRRAVRIATARNAYRKAARIEDIPLDEIDLPVRITFTLHTAGCRTVGDAMKLSDRELLREPNFGLMSLNQWHDFLGRLQAEYAAAHGQAPEITGK